MLLMTLMLRYFKKKHKSKKVFFQHLQLTSEMKSTVMTSNFMEKTPQSNKARCNKEKRSSSNLQTTLATLKKNASSS